MFEKLSVDRSYEPFYRDLTKHKSIKVLAKIDGENWYDISQYVKKVTVNNQIQLLDIPAIDTAKLIVKNDNNAFTSTVYNDVFNPNVGKINGTVEQEYLNKIWEIQIHTTVSDGTNTIDIPLFHGWKPTQAITEKHKEAEIELKDMLWITTQKRLKNPLLYTSMTPSAIIADLLNRCGLDSSYQDLQQLSTTFDVFIAEQDKSYWQVIQQICEATAGVISTGPDGKIIYRTRIENFTDPEIALTINQENFSKYNLEQKSKYNQLKVESEGYEISSSTNDLLVDTTLTGDAAIIKAGQTQNFEFEYTSEYGKDFANTVFITVKLGDTIVDNLGAFSQGDDDGFIRLNKLTAYPDKLVLNITNLASTVDYTIAQVRFRGRQIKKLSLNSVEELNVTDEPDNEISIKSYYSDTSILSNALDALKFNINKDIVFSLSLNEFYPDIFAGNLVSFNIPLKGIASGTFIIEQIKHIINDDLSYNTEVVLSEWKDIVFDIGTKEIYKSTPVEVITESSNQSQIEEIVGSIDELKEDMQEQKDITSYLDGVAPNTPTGLIVTTEVINRESVLKVSFNPNTESDLLGYEIAYSQDGIWWQYNIVSETSVYIQVIGNTEYFVKVRAFDAEGFKSAWSNVVSIVSAKDTIPPEAPTGLTVEPLFQKIIVKWTPNEEPDLLKYSVQVSLDNFVTVKDTIYTESNYIVYGGKTNTLYYFRVSAIDTSENMSEYSNVVSATTAAVYDEDIESAIIEEMENNLDTLNNETLPGLQEDLSMLENIAALEIPASFTMLFTTSLQDDISGVVPEGYEPVIRNGDFINTNLNRELEMQLGLINENITEINNLITQTENIETNIENINGTITNIQTTVDTHTSQISQTISDVTALVNRVTANEEDITTIEQTVGQIQTTVTSHETRISDAETTLVSYGTQITQNANSISSIATRVTDTETNITAIIQDVDSIESTVVSHSDTLETHATSIQQNANSITSIVSDINDINTNISSITQTVSQIQTTVSSHTTELGTLSTQVTQNADSITTVVSRVDTVETNISQIQQDIDSIELSVTSITGDISDINSNITTLDSRITIAEGNITSTVANVEMLENIAALEIPASFTMLFTTSLQDDISGVVPEGYEPVIRNGDFINTNLNRMIEVHETRITQTENDITLMALDIDGLETNFSQLQVTVNGINATVISQGETLDTHASQIQQLSNQITFAVAAVDENGNPVSGSSLILTADGKIKATADKFILYGDALVNGSITASKLGANSVTANAIGANQIITNSANIANGIIDTVHIKDAAIETAKIKDGAITNAKIGTAAVDTANIADLAVTNAKINDINAEKITAGYIDSDRIKASSITADKIAAEFILQSNQIIQAGTEDRNYKLDGTQGLIRTIGSNTYNIYCYVTSGEVNFDGTVTYKDIDLTDYGLTDYIAILNFQQMQFWRSDWTTSKNLTLTYEKISSNILRILAYFSDDVVWTTKTGPEIRFSSGDSWHTLVTTAADTTGVQVYRTATIQNVTASRTLIHYYRLPGTYTIKVRGNRIKVISKNEVQLYIDIDWGDGIITDDRYHRGDSFAQHNFSFKYVAEGHSGNPQPLFGKINYAVLGY